MKLSSTTIRHAMDRDVFVGIDDLTSYNIGVILTITEEEIETDACLEYFVNEDGTFTYKSNTWLPQEMKEELPATIRDEKELRKVISFVQGNIQY